MRTVLFLLFNMVLLFSSELKLTQKQAEYIARKVWMNEGAQLDKYLVHWNEGEDFASVGIGHFIWFSQGHTERFREVFPMVIAFMQERNVTLPQWLNARTPLPWNSKAEFYHAKKSNSKKYRELFDLLKRTMPQQAEFMAARLSHALPKMLHATEDRNTQQRIERRFKRMLYYADRSIDERGLYILLDYTNFKGEGTLESERYNGQGWGLLQVLEHMDENASDKYKAFADAAKAILNRRIQNAPPSRGEERWRKGWNVRLDTYWR